MVFDKTGTLTKGAFTVTEVSARNGDKERLLALAAHAESISNHPIAASILSAYGKPVDRARITEAEELPGLGIRARIDGQTVLVGNEKLMAKENIAHSPAKTAGTAVYVAVDGKFGGHILISDLPKKDAKQAVSDLKAAGIRQTVMLTGDSRAAGEQVAAELGIDRVYAELLPADKVRWVETLMAEGKGALAFVGDGINDAPVLARADVGIAMGGLGSDAAIEAADVVIMTDEPSKIASAIKLSRKTLRIARQNIVFALSVKAAVLLLGALGLAGMWAAVFADVGVSVLAIVNAMRTLNVKTFLKNA